MNTKDIGRILICTPAFDNNVKTGYATSIYKLSHRLAQEKIEHELQFLSGSLITVLRNRFAAYFLHGNYSHLLMVDGDIEIPDPEAVIRMLQLGEDLITLGCASKAIDWQGVAVALALGTPPETLPEVASFSSTSTTSREMVCWLPKHQLMPVPYVGTGVLLAKRSVFERLREAYPELAYKICHATAPNGPEEHFSYFNFFGQIIGPDGTLLSEDFAFSHRCTEVGIQPYVLTDFKTIHWGSFPFKYNRDEMQKLHARIQERKAEATKVQE